MWFRWVTDVGLPGPDRAQGGRYLFVGPGYEGPLPDGGFYVSHSRTNLITVIGRAFMVDNDPTPAIEAIRSGVRVSSYVPGAGGTAVASFLAGRSPLAKAPATNATAIRRRIGHGLQHDPAERLLVLGRSPTT